MPPTLTHAEKKSMIDKAKSAIILCLGDKALREVAKEKTAAGIWAKLESLWPIGCVSNNNSIHSR